MSDGAPSAGGQPRLAFVYHPRSFGTMAIAEAADGICQLIWVIDTSDPEISSMARLLRRLGDVVDVAGLSLGDAAAAIAAARPDGILALADSLLLWTARIADRLKLPFLSPEIAGRLTDKHEQRLALQRAGVPVPGFWPVPDRDRQADGDAWEAFEHAVSFPAILKPRRGEGSRDVVRVDSLDELHAQLADVVAAGASAATDGASAVADERPAGTDGTAAPASDELVLEEYLRDRPEAAGQPFADYVSVESVVSDGHVSHLAITGRFPPAQPFRETGFFIPCAFDQDQCAAIAEMATAAVQAIGLQRGALHTEVKLTPDGPRVIEVNGRIGGGVPEMLIDATGVEFLPMAIRIALGEQIVFDSMPACTQIGYLLYVQAPSSMHTITAVQGLDELRVRPGVEEVVLNRGPGRSVDWRAGNHGHVFSVRGSVASHQQLRSIEQHATREVQIQGA
ncbi:MAG TPA: ATP-grasp domain-containing protein [Solirubrobacteraceae bacterium]|jgi:biotin carboxylase|nr:ATP-grasp domain-containing protein [Solirubrobacteraceae bacterium]